MAAKHHDDLELPAGDTWEIGGALTNADGTPLDLTSAELGWTLLTPDGHMVAGLTEAATLTREEPYTSGLVTIVVPDSLTRLLPVGRYTDALRVWLGGAPSLTWIGTILVSVDPFRTDSEVP